MPNLLLHNAHVVTLDADHPNADAVAVRDGVILAAGTEQEAAGALPSDAERFDCQGRALLPAFIDAHCHLLAFAASLRSVDCRGARSIADIQRLIRQRAAELPQGGWVRAFGYEETSLAEGRHPNRRDLDDAAALHPVRLIHGSGHASVLNSIALRALHIDTTTAEPPGGVIERELPSGEPSGVLLDMERSIDRGTPNLPADELSASVREASARLLRAGITCIQDAGHTNGRAEWQLFERMIADGALLQSVVMMEGIQHLGELPVQAAGGRLRRGAVKLMIHEVGDSISPGEDDLAGQVAEVHEAGRQVAIHAVGARAVRAAVEAIERALRRSPRADHRHRIEHCGILPDGFAPRIAQLGITVVSQPAFLRERGDRYRQLVPESERSSLYAFRTLLEAGVALAAGSDAPVTDANPLSSIASAVDRRTRDGHQITPGQAVTTEDGLRWWTAGAASAGFLEHERGRLRAGLQADLILLSADPTTAALDELRQIDIDRVWIAGEAAQP